MADKVALLVQASQAQGPVVRRQFVLATCNAILAEKIIAGCSSDVRRTQLSLRLAMRLYFTPIILYYILLWYVPSQKIARQVAVGVSHAATCRVALRKVEAASTFSTTCNAIFRRETSCHTRKSSLQLAMQRHCVASCKENCLVWHGL